ISPAKLYGVLAEILYTISCDSLCKTKMESVGLEMDDIFGSREAQEAENGDLGALQNNEENNVEQAEDGDDENTFSAEITKKLEKGAAKKVVRNPQPKLNDVRLTGERGIALLPKLFNDVTFRGTGHEAKDLDKILKILEHWAHRLFPKMKFADCLGRIEKLGAKRSVQSCIKRIRLDMPVLDDDFCPGQVNDDDGDNDGNVNNNSGNELDQVNAAEAAWDQMMQTPNNVSSTSFLNSPPVFTTPSTTNPQPTKTTVLSAELQEKIARNRQLALERRAARLAASQGNPQSQVSSPVNQGTPHSHIDTPDTQSILATQNTPQNEASTNRVECTPLSEMTARDMDNVTAIKAATTEKNGDTVTALNTRQELGSTAEEQTASTPHSQDSLPTEGSVVVVATDKIPADSDGAEHIAKDEEPSMEKTASQDAPCGSVAGDTLEGPCLPTAGSSSVADSKEEPHDDMNMEQSILTVDTGVCRDVSDPNKSIAAVDSKVCDGLSNTYKSILAVDTELCQDGVDMDQSTVAIDSKVCHGLSDLDKSILAMDTEVCQDDVDMDQSTVDTKVCDGLSDTDKSILAVDTEVCQDDVDMN
ncbi:uncharacterized protein DDB_G0286591-like, partial [Argonauta hians]